MILGALAAAGAGAAALVLAWCAPGRIRIFCGFQWARYPALPDGTGPGVVIAAARAAGLVLAASALIALLWFAGRVVARMFRWRPRSRAESASIPFLLGIAIVGTAWLGAGLVGLFVPAVLLVLTALPVAGELRRGLAGPVVERSPARARLRMVWWPVLPGAFLLLQVAPYWLCPETDQDALNFHLALPERFLALRTIHLDPLEAGAYAFRAMPFDLLHAPAIAFGADAIARMLHAACLLAGLWLVGASVSGRVGVSAGWVAVLVAGGALSVANTAARSKNDLAAAAAVTAAWLVWRERNIPARAMLAALLAGCAVAVKLTTAPLAAALLAVIIASGPVRLRGIRFSLGLTGLSLLPIVPWLFRTWLITGDPAYPHGSPRWFPGLHWSAGSAEIWVLIGAMQSLRTTEATMAGAIWRWLTLDAPPLLLLLPLAVGSSRRPALGVVLAVAAGVALTLAGQPAARYLIPAVWILTALLVPAVAAGPRPAATIALSGAVALACLPHLFWFPAAGLAADDRARAESPWPYLLGAQDRDGFLSARLSTLHELRRAVAHWVPPRGRVLMHHDARGYGLGRIALRGLEDADEPVVWRWVKESRTPADMAKRFRQRAVAAMTVTPARYFRYDAEVHPFAWTARMLSLWRAFAARRVELVWRSGTESPMNGDYMLMTVAPRDRRSPGGPWPVLPATGAAWSRAAYRMQAAVNAAGGIAPRVPGVEQELLAIRALLPDVGEAALRLGHYRLVTGDHAAAAAWYRTARAEGFESCQHLARYATALPEGPERAAVIRRGTERCGAAFVEHLTDEARWRGAVGTMTK